ncbi:MAG: hypothetical protein O9340_04375 [Cyclobacteriaceae bacterium]|nr:hypothetical protein [Cyclobacteriaceae bacterium]
MITSDALPVVHNFKTIQRRDKFLGVSFDIYDDTDTAYNLAGCTAKMQVREKPGGPVVLEFSSANNTIVFETDGLQPVVNRLRLVERSESVMDIPGAFPVPKKYRYDIQINSPTYGTQTFFAGEFPVLDDITV